MPFILVLNNTFQSLPINFSPFSITTSFFPISIQYRFLYFSICSSFRFSIDLNYVLSMANFTVFT